jgi:hypothetical protein
MKRSEIVATIALEIAKQALENSIEDISWINTEYILKAIESKGMMPPRTYLKALNTYDNGWDDE